MRIYSDDQGFEEVTEKDYSPVKRGSPNSNDEVSSDNSQIVPLHSDETLINTSWVDKMIATNNNRTKG